MTGLAHLINASSITKQQLQSYMHSAWIIKKIYRFGPFSPNTSFLSRTPSFPIPEHHPISSHEQSRIETRGCISQYPHKTLITMFYEPSTRTNCSFQAAAIKLGCNVIALNDKASSSEKGESLEDTIRTLACYGDAIVLRHPMKGSAESAAKISSVPIINGGDGNGEHPTQALLDMYTIYEEVFERTGRNILFENISNKPLTITFVGDLKNSRTIHSLIRLLTLCQNIRFIYVSPPSLKMPLEITNHVASSIFEQQKKMSIADAIRETDVLYMTRIQRERFSTDDEYQSVIHNSAAYKLTPELMRMANEKMVVMHPLPRLEEIPPEIDEDDRAVYFKQVENGLYMRMAILDKIFSNQ